MTVKLKDLKLLPPDHKIFKVPFFTVSHNISEGKKKPKDEKLNKKNKVKK